LTVTQSLDEEDLDRLEDLLGDLDLDFLDDPGFGDLDLLGDLSVVSAKCRSEELIRCGRPFSSNTVHIWESSWFFLGEECLLEPLKCLDVCFGIRSSSEKVSSLTAVAVAEVEV
jgi:hypothetical protein